MPVCRDVQRMTLGLYIRLLPDLLPPSHVTILRATIGLWIASSWPGVRSPGKLRGNWLCTANATWQTSMMYDALTSPRFRFEGQVSGCIVGMKLLPVLRLHWAAFASASHALNPAGQLIPGSFCKSSSNTDWQVGCRLTSTVDADTSVVEAKQAFGQTFGLVQDWVVRPNVLESRWT